MCKRLRSFRLTSVAVVWLIDTTPIEGDEYSARDEQANVARRNRRA